MYLLGAFHLYFETVNPDKAWLFEGSLFKGGRVNLTPCFIFQEELIQYQLTSIELLRNEIHDIIKNHKKPAPHSIYKKQFLKKKTHRGRGQIDPPPVFLGLYMLLYVYNVNHSKKPEFNWFTSICMYFGWNHTL